MVICLEHCFFVHRGLERGTDDLNMVQMMSLPPHHLLLHLNPHKLYYYYIGLTFLVPAYPRCPGKAAIKRVPVLQARLELIGLERRTSRLNDMADDSAHSTQHASLLVTCFRTIACV